MRVRTTDRQNDFHTVEAIGRTRELTREGFLLLRDVRVARVGEMFYSGDELPEFEVGPDLILRVTRSADDLFRPETLASANGKPLVVDHPDDDVTPSNWRELSGGVGMNVRRGEGLDDGYMVADLLVQDQDTIDAIGTPEDPGVVEISLGYDADYEQLGPGRARQFNILINHYAFVDRGRCGPRCAIGDSEMRTHDAKQPRRTWKDRVLTAFKARDEEALSEAMESARDEMTNGVEGESGEGSEHRIVLEVRGPTSAASAQAAQGANDEEGEKKDDAETKDDEGEAPAWFKSFADDVIKRITALEASRTGDEEGEAGEKKDDDGEKTVDDEELDMGDLGVAGTNDEEGEGEGEKKDDEKGDGKTKDRASTRDSSGLRGALTDAQSRAEILLPGVRLPTFDSKDPAKRTLDRLCGFRRRVLVRAYEDADTRKLMAPLLAGRKPDFNALTCDAATMMFNAASELAKASNSSVISGYIHDGGDTGKPATIGDINANNRKFWEGKGGLAT